MANSERTTHAPDMIFFLLSRHPHPIPSLVRRGVALVGSTGRRSKGVATGNANELHERRQIEQHTTMVSSCHSSPAYPLESYNAATNLIESWLCTNTAVYVAINGYRNRKLNVEQCARLFSFDLSLNFIKSLME